MVERTRTIEKHKDCKTNTPFTLMTFDEVQIDELIEALVGKDKQTFTCHYCKERFGKDGIGGIFPPAQSKSGAIFLCKSPICLIEYYEEYIVDVKAEE